MNLKAIRFSAGLFFKRRSDEIPLEGSIKVYLLVFCGNFISRRRNKDGGAHDEDAYCASQSDMLQFIGKKTFKCMFMVFNSLVILCYLIYPPITRYLAR